MIWVLSSLLRVMNNSLETDLKTTDFTDRAYQVQLPAHARSTASQAVKNNIRITELMADKNIILKQQKVSLPIRRCSDFFPLGENL